MVLFNYATRELTAKIVYYGPGLCGKTTNLEHIHKSLPDKSRGKMLSLATQTDRTLFFDFLPIDLGSVKGMKTRVQLYTVPGQVFYDATRKLVLKGADGVVFVADSQKEMLESNLESWENLKQNLKENNLDIHAIPIVIQYNKRDLPNVMSIRDLNKKINDVKAAHHEAVALTGQGVQDTLKVITKLVLQALQSKYMKEEKEEEKEPVAVAAAPAVEEVKELPASEDLESPELSSLRMETLSNLSMPDESSELEELEEVELEEYHPPIPPPEPEPEPVPEPVAESVQPMVEPMVQDEFVHNEQAAIQTGPLTDIAQQAVQATLRVGSAQQDISIPVQVSVGKMGQDVKLQISIHLKINVLPD